MLVKSLEVKVVVSGVGDIALKSNSLNHSRLECLNFVTACILAQGVDVTFLDSLDKLVSKSESVCILCKLCAKICLDSVDIEVVSLIYVKESDVIGSKLAEELDSLLDAADYEKVCE